MPLGAVATQRTTATREVSSEHQRPRGEAVIMSLIEPSSGPDDRRRPAARRRLPRGEAARRRVRRAGSTATSRGPLRPGDPASGGPDRGPAGTGRRRWRSMAGDWTRWCGRVGVRGCGRQRRRAVVNRCSHRAPACGRALAPDAVGFMPANSGDLIAGLLPRLVNAMASMDEDIVPTSTTSTTCRRRTAASRWSF